LTDKVRYSQTSSSRQLLINYLYMAHYLNTATIAFIAETDAVMYYEFVWPTHDLHLMSS